jgi:hypothetical protein
LRILKVSFAGKPLPHPLLVLISVLSLSMKKMLQKIALLIAVFTMVGHSVLPHVHSDPHSDTQIYHDHHDQTAENHGGYDHHSDQHHLFSFGELDENYVTPNTYFKFFGLTAEFIPQVFSIYVTAFFPSVVERQYKGYVEYPPGQPDFACPSHRGPPFVC